ncbi:DNA ligase D [Sphingobacterium sp. HMA12]|uniref:DNA ligase D n=1 Tax=Sphingobacterium sp. HMA12 TaxID=2050894 RepID=UPI000CEA1EA6|nr:DNA ligase D [Sphingobacterium sp. HMA12]
MKKMPARIRPMLCTLIKEPIDRDDYLYEVKWDGYRIVSFVEKGKVHMDSRSGLNYTSKYPLVEKALKSLKHDVIIDGEVVVFNQEEEPDFDALQLYNGHELPIKYCVFDLLWMDGQDLRGFPLTERKELLKILVKDNDVFRYSESFDDGPALYQQMLDLNLEGIVAKKKDSVYTEGDRGNDWLKTPTRKRQEFVVGGWAESDKARSFKSLLFGAYENGKFTWIGRSGGGFKDKEMPGILKKLQAIETQESPFVNKVLDTKGAKIHWVKPQLVANFEFATWTKTGRIRKPATFLGFRLDKKPKQVVREVPKSTNVIEDEVAEEKPVAKSNPKKPLTKKSTRKYLNKDSNWQRVDESFEGSEVTDFPMKHCTVQLHDIGRELWKGVAKGDLILYYNKIAPYILPYLQDRPQSLNLKLTRAGGPTTFIKDMENRQPDCAEVFTDRRRVKKAGKRDQIDYLVCNNVETLLTMVDWGCVDINPRASRIQHPDQPDYIWLDLDPTVTKNTENEGFEMAIQVAIATKSVLDKHKLKGFVKTSGKTGLHIYIPCSGFSFEQTRIIANRLADEIHQLVPDISTRIETVNHRKGKVYIDANQNDYGDTLAAPYSVRPYHVPIVSTPLDWKEVKPGLDRYKFTMDEILIRIKKKGELFHDLNDEKITIQNGTIMRALI